MFSTLLHLVCEPSYRGEHTTDTQNCLLQSSLGQWPRLEKINLLGCLDTEKQLKKQFFAIFSKIPSVNVSTQQMGSFFKGVLIGSKIILHYI